jgi:hypothetical protein
MKPNRFVSFIVCFFSSDSFISNDTCRDLLKLNSNSLCRSLLKYTVDEEESVDEAALMRAQIEFLNLLFGESIDSDEYWQSMHCREGDLVFLFSFHFHFVLCLGCLHLFFR